MNLWDIVDGSKESPFSNVKPQVLKYYPKRVKNAMSIFSLNLVEPCAHIKSCTRYAKAWKIFCNILDMKSLSNIVFICCNFFTYKMNACNDMLDHVNKVKALADQLACQELLWETKIYLDLIWEFVDIVRILNDAAKRTYDRLRNNTLMHKMVKCKKNEPQSEDVVKLLQQNQGDKWFLIQGTKLDLSCGKPNHFLCFS